ncbi:MAG: ferritin-like domain-containing protein [Chthoniobacterales bacterium]
MNSTTWLHYFEQNRGRCIEPDWTAPSPLAPELRARLARSLSHFQLGESGGGQHLFRKATAQLADHPAYRSALELFVAEEAEHARLLQSLVTRFGGRLIQRHWTHFLFRTARRALGMNFEVQVLLIAELVGTAYYRMLQRRARDPILDQVCARILADEAQHVAFHLDRLRNVHTALLPIERAAWFLQFQFLFSAALHVAWIDHRDALVAIGTRREEFFGEARGECIRFLDTLVAGRTNPRPLPAFLRS